MSAAPPLKTCAWPGCTSQVERWMCVPHWRLLPPGVAGDVMGAAKLGNAELVDAAKEAAIAWALANRGVAPEPESKRLPLVGAPAPKVDMRPLTKDEQRLLDKLQRFHDDLSIRGVRDTPISLTDSDWATAKGMRGCGRVPRVFDVASMSYRGHPLKPASGRI